MAIDIRALQGGGPEAPARPLAASAARNARRRRLDRAASRLVVLGGIAIIAAILAILVVIVGEIYPLFASPRAELLSRLEGPGTSPAPGESIGVDEYREIAFAIGADGGVRFTALKGQGALPAAAPPDLAGERITWVTSQGKGPHLFLAALSDGRVLPVDIQLEASFTGGARAITARATYGPAFRLSPTATALSRVVAAAPGGATLTVGQVGPREVILHSVVEKKGLVGGGRREEASLPIAVDGDITALRVDGRGEDLYVGTVHGQVLRYDLRDRAAPRLAETMRAAAMPGARITALGFLGGDRTLVVGDGSGGVSTWQLVSAPGASEPRLARVHQFAAHDAAVVSISGSTRDKGFVTADARGGVRVHYGTSGRTLLVVSADGAGLRGAVLAPKADGVVATDEGGRLWHWRVHNPHPEVTLGTLFGKVWYEGYPAPAHVWQSTGGTDDFEAKLSLTPLVFGTLKGTFYALLFAVPLALLAALFVSEFMHARLKAYVKPLVEIMAALPSVVLGFLAGLWLAPMVERIVPGLFLLPPVAVVAILGALLLWRQVPMAIRGRFPGGSEVALLVPVMLVACWVAFALGGVVERALLGGSYRAWLLAALGLTYDQRNSLVVGIAMGFAVIPIIFTIAEDSLANVPQHLRAGSLALGATRWQTAVRIVLPTASPGIFSAVMIGFGRAVGETMIVLMATGNTPLMDWSIFNGFRALSANVAVELPEAPEGGTLFRVLFLAAFLLFCLTFAVNTVAELVRLRLRRRYRYL